MLIYLFTNRASQQQGVSSYCHIINTENGEVQNHFSKAYHYLYINKLHMLLTLQVISTRVEPMCCKVFPVDIQIVTSGVASCKYLFFTLFFSLLAFQVSSCNCYFQFQLLKPSERRFWHTSPKFDNHGVQNCLHNISFTFPHKPSTVTVTLNWSPQTELRHRSSKNNPTHLFKNKHSCKVPVRYPFYI